MSMGWPLHKLEELVEPNRPITYGVVKPGPEDNDSGVKFIRGGDIFNGRLAIDSLRTITHGVSNSYSRTLLRGGELVISLVGNPGHVAVVPHSLAGANLARQAGLIALRGDIDSDFIKFFLMSPSGRAELFSQTTGSVQIVINLANLRNVRVPLPPLPIQRRIAGILSAYDELIENNQRRIRILEDMARSLYREWFVHFRYPGHESVPLVESPLGQIPQGWEVTTLRAVTTKIGSGATPRGGKDAYKSEGIHLIRSMNIYDYEFEFDGLAFIDEQQAAELDNVTVEENDILLNITGASVARCALVPSYLLPARVNQHVAIVRADPAKASPFYILDAINSDQRKQQLLTLAQGGATREALTKDTVSNFEIVLPPRSLMKRYANIVRGIHMKREVLQRQIQNLRRTRDLLLPRLLSGQVSLSDVAMEATQ